MAPFQASSLGWHRAPGIPTTPVVKRVIRLDVPVDKYPNVGKTCCMCLSGVEFQILLTISK